ncbi:MAG: hypothetical protein ACR2RB_07690 [Gammaproteobacteria bacterium]
MTTCLKLVCGVILGVLLAACGGGGDSAAPTPGDSTGASVGGDVKMMGVVEQASPGTAYVNGIVFDTSRAQVLAEGSNDAVSTVEEGQLVTVVGEVNNDGVSGVAFTIEIEDLDALALGLDGLQALLDQIEMIAANLPALADDPELAALQEKIDELRAKLEEELPLTPEELGAHLAELGECLGEIGRRLAAHAEAVREAIEEQFAGIDNMFGELPGLQEGLENLVPENIDQLLADLSGQLEDILEGIKNVPGIPDDLVAKLEDLPDRMRALLEELKSRGRGGN